MVRPKKYLGQHFLKDQGIARKIVDALTITGQQQAVVFEIGPGMGVLTRILLERKDIDLHLIEIDKESVAYLHRELPVLSDRIIAGDFLTINWWSEFHGPLHIIGNFPYNISSQIFFRVLERRDRVEQV
ncbi:MAG TPA: rRNA adenine N-6-methyltransferase family protein, partial [Cyclobacteriaceae bacterium]|nr:rRNA adenine N-6-methyltransferase family protein [Cyclobacteriaceae bacterium]